MKPIKELLQAVEAEKSVVQHTDSGSEDNSKFMIQIESGRSEF